MKRKKKLLLLGGLVLLHSSIFAQIQLDVGANYLNFSSNVLGVGAYLQPGYSLGPNAYLRIRLGYNAFLGEDLSRTQSSRVESGRVPTVSTSYIRRFPSPNAREISYVGLGVGFYLPESDPKFFEGSKVGIPVNFGAIIGRSNFGLTYNYLFGDGFFQLSYGFRIVGKR